jgi:thiol-disulfide isomerase/thioredoxin
MRLLLRALLVVVMVLSSGCTGGERTGISPSDKAPKITGLDPAGSPLSLYDIKGKVILVNFWATWCAPCMQELPHLQALYSNLKDRGFQLVGVAVDDTAENVREAQKSYGLTFPIIIETGGTSKRRYELKGFPESFVLDSDHRVLFIQDPEDGTPVTKIIGPRDWSSPAALKTFSALLHRQSMAEGAK